MHCHFDKQVRISRNGVHGVLYIGVIAAVEEEHGDVETDLT